MKRSVRVGIIGGGAAGVTAEQVELTSCVAVAAKCLREAGHSVILWEKAAQLGGVWKYEDATQTDASMYMSLRTNLPTSVMQLAGFPFPSAARSFVSHREVLQYIQSYATHYNVTDVASLQSIVVGISKQPSVNDPAAPIWKIDVESAARGQYSERVDKVLVCNGHFAVPFCAQIPGMEEHFKGESLHSHDYRTPTPYIDKRVLLLGCGPSGQDISLELVRSGARQVTVAFKEVEEREVSSTEKRILKPPIDRILPNGVVRFVDGSTTQEPVDVIMYCTGYRYVVQPFVPCGLLYPDLALPKDLVQSDLGAALKDATAAGSALAPLYRQLFSIEEPDLAFIGLPYRNLPFLCFELQAKWAAEVFSGAVTLPTQQQMYEAFVDEVRTLPFPVRKLHQLGSERQQHYFEALAMLSNSKCDRHVREMFEDAGFLRATYPFHYRDAQYAQEPAHGGHWVRRLITSSDGPDPEQTQELVRVFD